MLVSAISNAGRSASFRTLVEDNSFCRILEVHSPISAIVADHALGRDGQEFHGFWSSSLTDSALRGLPDIEILDPQLRLNWIDQIFAVTGKPMVMDGDTGGKSDHFVYRVAEMERHGVSAVVIEDKQGDKRNSLLDDARVHTLATVEEFSAKIAAGKAAQLTPDFMIFARLEGLIVGLSEAETLRRAQAYLEAGADGLVIHSKQRNSQQVVRVARQLRTRYTDVPLVAIPTTYPQASEAELVEAGFNIVIYANHMLRASVRAMEEVCHRILDHSRALEAEEVCIETAKIIGVADDPQALVRTASARRA